MRQPKVLPWPPLMLCAYISQLHIVLGAGLFQDACTVSAHGVRGQTQLRTNFAHGVALRQQKVDLVLAVRELFNPAFGAALAHQAGQRPLRVVGETCMPPAATRRKAATKASVSVLLFR